MKRPISILVCGFLLVASSPIPAQIDTNANTLSDLWEQNYNFGDLFPITFDPNADPDKDGWTNAQEAAAGTDPFDPNPPNGFLRPDIINIPAVFGEPDSNGDPVLLSPNAIRVAWQTIPGKKYTLLYSPNLESTSWLPVEESFIGTGSITEYNFPLANPSKTFWRVRIEDTDSDGDGLTDAEENQLGLNAALPDTDGDGVPDKVEIDNGTDPKKPDTDGDGLTDGQEIEFGTNPFVVDDLGLVNSGFQKSIDDFPTISFRPENPADLYDQSSVPGWQAEVGQHIEIWDEGGGNRYVELQAHLGAHGIKQTFKMVPGTQISQILRYKGRYTWENYDNAFTLKVQGAAEMKIDGVSAALSGNLRSKSFMEDDEFDKYTDWHAAVITITAPTGGTGLVSITLSLVPNTITNYTQEDITYGGFVDLLPVEVAPEVLAVNSDFDEGRIDPATGYAIPDCDDIPGVDQKTGSGNTQIALNASRAHLDGLFANDEKVTDDMHKGWFGVNPNQLGDDFWAGANVTIRKIDKDDPDTGYKESGQVRFYAKWSGGYYGISPYDFQTLQPVNLVSAGVNLRSGEGVYGASSTIPDGAEFYIEGVRPGKITLEWRLQKGSIDVKHEQTFKVETRKTVAQWQEEVRYQIRLQTKVKSGTEVDVALYHIGNGFRNANAAQDNVLRVNAIYEYYQQLFKQMPEKFMWAGMAKVAAAPIYAGMSDLNTWWIATGVTPPWPPYQGLGDRDYGIEVFIEGLLLDGQKRIFNDKAWAHRAYKSSGIGALKHVETSNILATNFAAWRLMDLGIYNNNQSNIVAANGDLLRREQQEVVQQNYDIVQNLQIRQPPAHPSINGGVMVAVDANGLANAGEWLSANSNNNPLPGGPGFRATIPGGRLDFFGDRWAWTSNGTNGMLQIWTGASTSAPGFNAGMRASENGKTIKSAASAYSYDPSGLP
jgi:hypothetical protein